MYYSFSLILQRVRARTKLPATTLLIIFGVCVVFGSDGVVMMI